MAGKWENLAPMWGELQKHLDLEPPVPMQANTYLGCNQLPLEPSLEQVQAKSNFYQTIIQAADSAAEANTPDAKQPIQKKAGKKKAKKPKTAKEDNPTAAVIQPHIPNAYNGFKNIFTTTDTDDDMSEEETENDESETSDDAQSYAFPSMTSPKPPVRGIKYNMTRHVDQCIEKYIELAGITVDKLHPASTPCMDDYVLRKGPADQRSTSKCMFKHRTQNPIYIQNGTTRLLMDSQ